MFAERTHDVAGRRFRRGALALGASLGAFVLGWSIVAAALAQDRPQRRVPEGFPDLVSGLRGTPGCLGVETAKTASGKQVIFAWFEDRAAVLKWYNSDMHRQTQDRFFPKRPPHKPLKDVPDDVGPILAIAALTWADSSSMHQTTLPVTQISIELYKPLPGGVFAGGRFAPESLKVPGMLDYTPRRE